MKKTIAACIIITLGFGFVSSCAHHTGKDAKTCSDCSKGTDCKDCKDTKAKSDCADCKK